MSTLFELTSNPIGPAYRNPGADSADLHGMTIIGVSAIIAMAILALVAAYDQTTRDADAHIPFESCDSVRQEVARSPTVRIGDGLRRGAVNGRLMLGG